MEVIRTKLLVGIGSVGINGILDLCIIGLDGQRFSFVSRAGDVGVILEVTSGSIIKVLRRHLGLFVMICVEF